MSEAKDEKAVESFESPEEQEYDDTLKSVPEEDTLSLLAKGGASAFVLTKLQALEKPRLEEELIEPDGGSACGCNSVCACVPVDTCACDQVCTCDTVASCHSYSSGCYGGGGGYGGYWQPCW